MGWSLSGSSVHGILQARIWEWVAISFSGGSSWPRDQARISYVSCISSKLFTTSATGEALAVQLLHYVSGIRTEDGQSLKQAWMPLWYFTNSPLTLKNSKWVRTAQKSISMPHRLRLQLSSVAQSCPTLCGLMNRSTSGLPVRHQLPEFTQTHVHRVGDAIQPFHPLSSPSPPALIPS